MNSQIIIDFPILASGLFMYFGIKGAYKVLCYFLPEHCSPWHSGYISGHNALADQLRPKIDKLVEQWEQLQAHQEQAQNGTEYKPIKKDDRQVPGQE